MIPDISEKSYDNRSFPILYAQDDFTENNYFFAKDNEVSPYYFSYIRLVRMMKSNLVNIQIRINMGNAPML